MGEAMGLISSTTKNSNKEKLGHLILILKCPGASTSQILNEGGR
jgi:hypothetical protein